MKKHSQKFLRQRKAMLVLPVIVLPFICFIFWVLGGGKTASSDEQHKKLTGLNTQLPDAQIKEQRPEGKLAFYEQSDKDSVKLQEAIQNDPYFNKEHSTQLYDTGISGQTIDPMYQHTSPQANEAKINRKLQELYQGLNESSLPSAGNSTAGITEQSSNLEIGRLEEMMNMMNQTPADDPEMKQLDGMLNKILDIQHPNRVQERLKEQSLKNKKQVFTVNVKEQKSTIELLKAHESPLQPSQKVTSSEKLNGFYEWSEHKETASTGDAIEAVIQETRTVVTGSTLKLRLLMPIYVNGVLIPKGHFVYGTCAINDDRLNITLSSLRYGNSILPVSLVTYDMDGIAGLYMPGAISRDVAKNTADDAIQSVDLYTMDNSLPLQAANVGVNAAKSLLSKKAKLIKVTVKAGYRVLLKDSNQQ